MADVKKKTTKVAKVGTEVKTVAQWEEELTKLQAAHLESQKSHRSGELVNPHVLTVQRKDIARAFTALNAAKKLAVKEEN
jgi:ribosomal protein L29